MIIKSMSPTMSRNLVSIGYHEMKWHDHLYWLHRGQHARTGFCIDVNIELLSVRFIVSIVWIESKEEPWARLWAIYMTDFYLSKFWRWWNILRWFIWLGLACSYSKPALVCVSDLWHSCSLFGMIMARLRLFSCSRFFLAVRVLLLLLSGRNVVHCALLCVSVMSAFGGFSYFTSSVHCCIQR